jgi:SpoVK/Ycf46/Vps4 family AAA+-type ATPase
VGLTYEEVANVWAKSLERDRKLSREDIDAINEEKKQIIQKSGLLEYYPAEETFAQVGGLEALKKWLHIRRDAFSAARQGHKLPPLKGILLIGIPGCGKSLSAKAVAAEWQVPLVRLDVGRIYEPLLGKAEANFRKAIKIVEGLAPVVLWVDEVEKGFPQTAAVSDSGTSMRVLGYFLSWMQEKTKPVFVVATANDIERMPWELTRKGRFDEIFFVGLPIERERIEILEIHLKKWGLELSAKHIGELARRANNFTGAEIEQVVRNSLWALPPLSNEQRIQDTLLKEIDSLHPLAGRLEENQRFQNVWNKAREIAIPASGTEPIPIPSPKEPDELSWRGRM